MNDYEKFDRKRCCINSWKMEFNDLIPLAFDAGIQEDTLAFLTRLIIFDFEKQINLIDDKTHFNRLQKAETIEQAASIWEELTDALFEIPHR